MSNFFDLVAIDKISDIFEKELSKQLEVETISIIAARDRILAQDIVSAVDLPPFTRSTMDGYAVQAQDTFGATENLPVYLNIAGEVEMGSRIELEIKSGQAVAIPTGGMLPSGADAVVMVEYTETLDENDIEITTAVAAGENIVQKGEDISRGDTLLKQGHLLRSQDIGALAGIGITEVDVFAQPKVTIFSTGDELVAPEEKPELGEIRDINSYSLGAVVEKVGAEVDYGGIIADEKDKLQDNLAAQLDSSDLIILSGGSSVGVKDLTIEVLNELGEPGVMVHGVSIKPGKPTILALVEQTPIVGLPGHPTSALVVLERIVVPMLQSLAGRSNVEPQMQSQISAKLGRNLASTVGREEYVRVSLEKKEELWANPIMGKSSLITTMVEADGLVKIELGKEGLKQGEEVQVLLFE
ncbi:MAG: gephyrin-like molybdotransferase Glp [Bacillota bacterium]